MGQMSLSDYEYSKGTNFLEEDAPDAATVLHFRHLLDENGLNELFFDAINRVMAASGHMMKGGTIVDAAIIDAPSSKKNAEKKRDPEMHQAKKGGQWRFGVCAVQRYILKGAKAPDMRDRRAFEEDAFGKLWQADTCYPPHILEDGHRRRFYCIMIIDDHSRLLVGGGLFYRARHGQVLRPALFFLFLSA